MALAQGVSRTIKVQPRYLKYSGRGVLLSKLKVVDTILSAIGLLITAAKAIIKFIGCVGKLKENPA